MEKRRCIVCVLAAFLLLSACADKQKNIYEHVEQKVEQGEDAGKQENESEPDDKEGTKDLSGELTVKMNSSSSEKQFATKFMELYPNVKISFIGMQEGQEFRDFTEGLVVELMSGNAADIVDASVFDYPKIAQNGLLCDLNEFMEKDPDFSKEDYFTNIFETFEADGKLCAIPLNFSPYLVWLDKKVTKAMALDMTQYETIDINQILDIYEEAKASDILPDGYTLSRYGPTAAAQNERDAYYSWKDRTVNFNCPEYIALLERLKQIEKPEKGWSTEGLMIYSDNRLPEPENDLMFPYWPLTANHIRWLELESEDWNRPIPYATTKGDIYFECNPLGISKGSENRELAWEFLKYCISEKNPEDFGTGNQDIWYKDLFPGIPVNRVNCRKMAEYIYSQGLDEEVYRQYLRIAESCNLSTFLSYDLIDAWGNLGADYDQGVISTEDYVQELQKRTEMYFAE